MPLNAYLSLLRTEGAFVQLGAAEDTLPAVNAFSLIAKGVQIGGSLIGPPAQIREMLDLAVRKGVHPVVQEQPMREANQAVRDMAAGRARYRFVLVNEKNLA